MAEGLSVEEILLSWAGALAATQLQAPNPNRQKPSVFIVWYGPSHPRPPWLYLVRAIFYLSFPRSLLLHRSLPLQCGVTAAEAGAFPVWPADTQARFRAHTHTLKHTLRLSSALQYAQRHTDRSWTLACLSDCPLGNAEDGKGRNKSKRGTRKGQELKAFILIRSHIIAYNDVNYSFLDIFRFNSRNYKKTMNISVLLCINITSFTNFFFFFAQVAIQWSVCSASTKSNKSIIQKSVSESFFSAADSPSWQHGQGANPLQIINKKKITIKTLRLNSSLCKITNTLLCYEPGYTDC